MICEEFLLKHLDAFLLQKQQTTSCYIGTESEKTDPVKILTGVNEEDPMSPVLFNLALDPLLSKLETDGQGIQREGLKVTVSHGLC